MKVLPSILCLVALASVASAETVAVPLTDVMPLSRGRDAIRIREAAPLSQIEFRWVNGSTRIDRVYVKFADGTSQVVDLAVVLDANLSSIRFAIAGTPRDIDQLIVVGTSTRRSNLQLFGL